MARTADATTPGVWGHPFIDLANERRPSGVVVSQHAQIEPDYREVVAVEARVERLGLLKAAQEQRCQNECHCGESGLGYQQEPSEITS